MPSEFKRKQVDETLVGLIFAVFSLAVIFGSPLMGYVIKRVGRRNPMIYGSYLLGASLLIFAAISFLDSKTLFIAASFAARILQGIGFTFIQVTCLSIAATFYPKHRARLIGLLEAAAGGGMMLGPLIGTGLFTVGGYVFMLSALGVVFIVMGVLMPFILPKYLDQYTDLEQGEIVHEEAHGVTVGSLLTMPRYLMPCLAGFLGYFQFDFFGPILGIRLLDMGLDEEQTGLFFCILSSVYIIGCVFCDYLPKRVEKRVWIIIGLVASFPT
jgi:MFS family permease